MRFVMMLAAFPAACIDKRDGDPGDVPDTVSVVDVAESDSDATPDVVVTADGVELPCECESGEVYRQGSCVPTLDLGCGPGCDGDCPEGLTCDDCAASSSCAVDDCRAACVVPLMPHAVVPDPLRIAPVAVAADGVFAIEGTSFYIGALGHRVRFGGNLLESDMDYAGDCTLTVTVPAGTAAGIHLVEVSQYSGSEPWVVAGFVHVDTAPSCVQPGFACGSSDRCCSSDASGWACANGRCAAR